MAENTANDASAQAESTDVQQIVDPAQTGEAAPLGLDTEQPKADQKVPEAASADQTIDAQSDPAEKTSAVAAVAETTAPSNEETTGNKAAEESTGVADDKKPEEESAGPGGHTAAPQLTGASAENEASGKHTEGEFTTHDKTKLYVQSWIPPNPKAGVLIVHGLAEHSGRYAHVAEHLNQNGYAVFAFDGRGHGKTSKPKPTAFYNNIDEYVADVDLLFKDMVKKMDDKPCFIFGHSMGGGVTTYLEITRQPAVTGIILSGAAICITDSMSKFEMKMAPFVSKVMPKIKAVKIDATTVSRDPEVVEKYNNDPLNYTKNVPARTGNEMLNMTKLIDERMEKFTAPVLIMHGTSDRLTFPRGSQALYDRAQSQDKTLKWYEGCFHELVNEPEKELVMSDMVEWLDVHVALRSSM